MISFELAKRLKDAGFPQRYGHENSYYHLGNVRSCWEDERMDDVYEKDNDPFIPTLSELIEWCGPMFTRLVRANGHGWIVYSDKSSEENVNTWGSTPEEAVAELGIALHTKLGS